MISKIEKYKLELFLVFFYSALTFLFFWILG